MAPPPDQMRYFINKKIRQDSNWPDVKVVFSGHEVPGEGEHKIMEYIQHGLYWLDADLIMLAAIESRSLFFVVVVEGGQVLAVFKEENREWEVHVHFLCSSVL